MHSEALSVLVPIVQKKEEKERERETKANSVTV